MDIYSCLRCEYVYDVDKGDSGRAVSAGTGFDDLPWEWTCPVCGAPKDLFVKGHKPAKPRVRRYENESLVVLWRSDLCNHNGNCTRSLPAVFDVDRRPWVDVNGAEPERIKEVIDQCPTGALIYDEPTAVGNDAQETTGA